MEAMVEIEREVIEILAASAVDGNILFLPPVQLERKTYEKVNKCLVLLGGKWNRKAGGHVFEDGPADMIEELLLTGEVFDQKKEYQFFETPSKVAKIVCKWAEINEDCNVLEPSAGKGNIANEILTYSPRSITVVELDKKHAPFLNGKYDQCFVGQDFLTWNPPILYDRIVMNPPFSKKRDIRHILRAFDLLEKGGILVSILSPSPFFCQDRLSVQFREFLNKFGCGEMDFAAGEFKVSGTSVRTKAIKVMK
jgi:predicted RNA methylase